MKQKINLRLLGIAILAVLATLFGITIVYYGLFQKQVRKDLSISADLLKHTHYFESLQTNQDEIDFTSDLSGLRVTWIASDGTVLYDNDLIAGNLENHANRPEIREAFLYGEAESVRKSDTMNENTFYYAVLLDNGTVLRVATNAKSVWSVLISALPLILFIVLLILILCVVVSHMLTKQLIKPIETMAKSIENAGVDTPYKELIPFAKMIRQQHAEILSAAKARQDFTANVSHELKTPLTAISGYAELIENEMVDKESEIHFLQEIRKNADRLLALINDIIKLSELDRSSDSPVFEELDLYEMVMEGTVALRMNAERGKINLSVTGEHATVRANREMIRELIDNLVQNAIRYNNAGGEVCVQVICEKGRAVLSVSDNGIGIPKEDQQRVFERFYRVDKSRSKATGGTGLGLAIVKHIVEIHDAKIELSSEVNVGTTVKVSF